MRRKRLKSTEDLKFQVVLDKQYRYITVVTNYGCGKCYRELNLREGLYYYPKEEIALCAKCELKRHPKLKKEHVKRFPKSFNEDVTNLAPFII